MLKIDENTNAIFLTRGDNAEITIALTQDDEPYDYSDDTVKFGMKRSAFDEKCVLEKDIKDGKLVLTEDDTKNLGFGDYIYDIELRHVDDSGEEPVTSVYTPIAAAKFTIGYNVL